MQHLSAIQSVNEHQPKSDVSPLVQNLIDSMPSNTALLDAEGSIIATNRQWKQFADSNGLRHSARCLGQNYLETCAKSAASDPIAAKALNGISAVVSGHREFFEIEYPCHSPSEQRWFSMTATPILCPGQARVILSHHNITGRVMAEQTVQRQHEYLETILRTAPDAIIAFEENGHIRSWNRAAGLMFTFDRAFSPKKTVFDLLPDLNCHQIAANTTLESKVTGDSTVEVVEVALNKFDSGSDLLWIAGIRDITERKRFEKRLEQFYLMVSHDLRSPLASVTGSLSLITAGVCGDMSEEASELLCSATQSSNYMMRLIDDFLDFKKIEANRIQLNLAPVSARRIFCNAKQKLDTVARNANLTIALEADEEIQVVCDETAITQVLINLLSNALKFSPSGTQVTLAASPQGKACRISVSDEGVGIPVDKLDKIFEPFESANKSEQDFVASSGLGLALVKSMIDMHKSSIAVEPRVPCGTVFHFDLPIRTNA